MTEALECFKNLHEIDEGDVERMIYGILVAFIAISSLLLNFLLTATIRITNAVHKHFSPYVLCATTAGMMEALANVLTLSPAILFNIELQDPTNIILSTTDTLGYLTLMFTTTVIAIDRFLFFRISKVVFRMF